MSELGVGKREKKTNLSRLNALQQLQNIKRGGAKQKYEIEPLESVYEEISEKEYSEKVLERQEDDWIVDDDGAGYVEDGREIFDDDLDEESVQNSKTKQRPSKKRDRDTMVTDSAMGPKGDIKRLLMNMPQKKKKEMPASDNAFFDDLIQEVASQDLSPVKNEFKIESTILHSQDDFRKPENGLSKSKPSFPKITDEEIIDVDLTAELNFDDDFEMPADDAPKLEIKASNVTKVEPVIEEKKSVNSPLLSKTLGPQNEESFVHVNIDTKNLPTTTNEAGKKVFRFYYLDAYEDSFKQPGVVYLFGKVFMSQAKTYVSCCIVVKNIERLLYLLPREETVNTYTKKPTGKPVSLIDVYNEFNEKISPKYNILQFKSRKVTKNYAFSLPNIPVSSDYLEVRYKATDKSLPSDLSGETFSHVFGTNTSFLELLILERKIKGPCWLEIVDPEPISNSISWCKMELNCPKLENVQVSSTQDPAPPLVVATINLQTCLNEKSKCNEIVMISCLVHNSFPIDKPAPSPPFQYHFCVMTRPSDKAWCHNAEETLSKCQLTKIEKVDNERALLGLFLVKMFKIDPDFLNGHDLSGFVIDMLLHRIMQNKIPHWSRIGRLRRNNPIQTRSSFSKNPMCGRLVCDLKIIGKELIQKARSFDLGPLIEQVLNVKEGERRQIKAEQIRNMYNSIDALLSLIRCTMEDAVYIARILCELNAIPLAVQITNIAGNVLSRTLMGGRAERNEYLLLHAFTEKDFIVPDKVYGKKGDKDADLENDFKSDGKKGSSNRKKPSYSGGLVLEPKRGFYDKLILLMDFNSLYPSIIQEYNICFTTISFNAVSLENEDLLSQIQLPEADQSQGILPTEIRKLVESRSEVKKLMKQPNLSPELKLQYNIRQLALKLTANSMYGCLGFSNSRFYAKTLAALVTFKGRDILLSTRDLVQKLNYEVIYGDTDSLMINTNCLDLNEVYKIGLKIKSEVNKMYKQLELDLDGIFRYMLLLKKKKYAAMTIAKLPNGQIEMKKEMKGLDIVRRDWSKISAVTGEYILDQILSDQSSDERIMNIHEKLHNLKEELEAGKTALNLLCISKNLTKNPEDYADKKSLPHVQVAIRLNSNAAISKKFRQGDVISYIICDDGTDQPATQRAYHIDELQSNPSLKPDIKYYLSQQIHPVVSRLCDPIEGTDAAQIAEHLGLDPTSYRQSMIGRTENPNVDESALGTLTDEERYKRCRKFSFQCSECKTEIILEGPLKKGSNGKAEYSLSKCSNPQCTKAPFVNIDHILNKLTISIRFFIKKYYENWLICEDPACSNRTRRIPLIFQRGYPKCNLCHQSALYREFSEEELFLQLSYFKWIFELNEDSEITDLTTTYQRLKQHVDNTLKYSAYSFVNLDRLFFGLFPKQ